MSRSNHPCWTTAVHEASHIAVYLKLGGKWGTGKHMRINQECGGVELGVLWDYKYGNFLDYCVYAAGVAADRIEGVYLYDARGSDMYEIKNLAIDHRLSEADIELVISRVETWLRKHSRAVERAAKQLITARGAHGQIPMSKSKKIVEEMREMLPCCRKKVWRKS
jgi:hypothetical protein